MCLDCSCVIFSLHPWGHQMLHMALRHETSTYEENVHMLLRSGLKLYLQTTQQQCIKATKTKRSKKEFSFELLSSSLKGQGLGCACGGENTPSETEALLGDRQQAVQKEQGSRGSRQLGWCTPYTCH